MEDNYKKTLLEFFGLLAFLWLLWYFNGGPTHTDRLDKPFLKPPSPINTNEVYGELPSLPTNIGISTGKSLRVGGASEYSDARLSFSKSEEGEGEYIELYVLPTSKYPVNLTGWKIKGVIDSEARIIGTGVYSFKQGEVNDESNILIYPGEKALIIPGESPVGVSFKLNKCTGYLEQFQTFSPHLPQNCPQFALDGQAFSGNAECSVFARSILRCNAYVKEFPSSISQSCGQLISKRLNYNSCVSDYSIATGFRKPEWRVYLEGKDSFGSKDGDLISIFDANNNLIDSIFYSK